MGSGDKTASYDATKGPFAQGDHVGEVVMPYLIMLFPFLYMHRRVNFSGFRDMPLSAGLVRKPSTCSLPAALLVEKGITPSSSYEGLSPASSTCSLDIINQRGNIPARLHVSLTQVGLRLVLFAVCVFVFWKSPPFPFFLSRLTTADSSSLSSEREWAGRTNVVS